MLVQSNRCRYCGSKASKLPGRGSSSRRWLDRYLGIPLVFLVGHFRTRRSLPSNPRKIGLLNTAALGDTILMSGPVSDLRAAYPDAEIIFLSGPSNYEAASLLEGTDSVINLPVFSPFKAIKIVRDEKIDFLLDFGPWSRLNALIAICSGAGLIAGFRTNAQARHFGYDVIVEHCENAHELENYRGLVRALGILPSHPLSVRREMTKPPTVSDVPLKPYVVLHLWAGGTAARLKEWPLGRWVALAEDLAANQYDIVLTGSVNQRSLSDAVVAAVKDSLRPRVRNLAGTPLRDVVRLLLRAKLVVSVDTGVMHLAAALGVPLVALHGPSSPLRWGPVSEKALVVEPLLEGCGFLNLGFEKRRNAAACMNAISYGRVKRACDALLARPDTDSWTLPSTPVYGSSVRDHPAVTPPAFNEPNPTQQRI
jgi:ADP-heptose:LPS heptosyltransferase